MSSTIVADQDHESARAAEALQNYVAEHSTELVALPELIDAIATQAETSVTVAKENVFQLLDNGGADFTPEFKIRFLKAS